MYYVRVCGSNEESTCLTRFNILFHSFDAGYATALGKPLITLHPPSLSHMLKEVNAAAHVVCEEPEQVVHTLQYVIQGKLPEQPRDGDAYVPIADRLGKGNPNP